MIMGRLGDIVGTGLYRGLVCNSETNGFIVQSIDFTISKVPCQMEFCPLVNSYIR